MLEHLRSVRHANNVLGSIKDICRTQLVNGAQPPPLLVTSLTAFQKAGALYTHLLLDSRRTVSYRWPMHAAKGRGQVWEPKSADTMLRDKRIAEASARCLGCGRNRFL